jgi:hypothetical protein
VDDVDVSGMVVETAADGVTEAVCVEEITGCAMLLLLVVEGAIDEDDDDDEDDDEVADDDVGVFVFILMMPLRSRARVF